MANRSRAMVVSRIGKETTPGTAVNTTIQLPNTRIMLFPAGDPNPVTVPSGYLYPADQSNAVEWGAGTYEMKMAYDECYVLFNSLLKAVTPTGGGPYTRVWTPSVNALDTYDTYTAEMGQSGSVDRFTYMVFNSMKFTAGKQENPLFTGDVFAQEVLPTTAFAGSPTTVASSPIAATTWNAYTGATFGAVTTQYTLDWKLEFNYGPKLSPAFYMSSAEPSFDALGIGDPIPNSVNITVAKDVSGSDYTPSPFTLAAKRAGTLIFVTLRSVSGTNTYKQDMALKIVGMPTSADIGPFQGQTWPCRLFVDPVSNKALEITTISSTA